MKNLVCIQTYTTRTEAEIAKGFLEANGINATISADDEGRMAPYPFQPSSSRVRLMVNGEDSKKAQEILENYTKTIIDIHNKEDR